MLYTTPMGFWKKFFGLEKKSVPKSVKEELGNLRVGDLVFLKFKTPKEIGIVSGQELCLTRLNRNEAAIRKVQGSVTRVWKDEGLKAVILEVATYSSPDMPGTLRKMTFLQDEIEELRKLDE